MLLGQNKLMIFCSLLIMGRDGDGFSIPHPCPRMNFPSSEKIFIGWDVDGAAIVENLLEFLASILSPIII